MTRLLALLRDLFAPREIETITVSGKLYEQRNGRLYDTAPVSKLPGRILRRVL